MQASFLATHIEVSFVMETESEENALVAVVVGKTTELLPVVVVSEPEAVSVVVSEPEMALLPSPAQSATSTIHCVSILNVQSDPVEDNKTRDNRVGERQDSS